VILIFKGDRIWFNQIPQCKNFSQSDNSCGIFASNHFENYAFSSPISKFIAGTEFAI